MVIERAYLNTVKVLYHKHTEIIILNDVNKTRCPLSPLLFNIVLEVPDKAIRDEKERKEIQIGKEEVKLSMFADDMILYIENPKENIRKLLELIKETQDLYAENDKTLRKEIKDHTNRGEKQYVLGLEESIL